MQKIRRGSGFGGVLSYLLDHDDPEIIAGSISAGSANQMTREFVTLSETRPDIAKPVWHNSLRLPAGEHLTAQKWTEIATDYMRDMGFDDGSQWIAIRHNNSDGEHIHIVANRVQPDSSIYYGKDDNLRSTRIISDLERRHGLTITKSANYDADGNVIMPDKSNLSKNEIEQSVRTGEAPTRSLLQSVIDEALTDRPTIADFADRLQMAGVSIRPNIASTGRVNGLSFELNDVAFSGSKLGKKYGWAQLQKRIDYQPDRDNALLQKLKEQSVNNEQIRADQQADTGPEPALAATSADDERAGPSYDKDDHQTQSVSEPTPGSGPATEAGGGSAENGVNDRDSDTDFDHESGSAADTDEIDNNNTETKNDDRSTTNTGATGKKPGVGRPGSRPPAAIRNSLHGMSLRNLDRFGGRSTVLLPSNVFDELEHVGTIDYSRLRWSLFNNRKSITNEDQFMSKQQLVNQLEQYIINNELEAAGKAFAGYINNHPDLNDNFSELASDHEHLIFNAVGSAIDKTGDERLMLSGREIVGYVHSQPQPQAQAQAQTAGPGPDETLARRRHREEDEQRVSKKKQAVISGRPRQQANPAEMQRLNQRFSQTLALAFEQRGNDYYYKKSGKLAFSDQGDKITGTGLHNDNGVINKTAVKAMAQASQIKFGDDYNITGSDDFLREMWLQSSMLGSDVSGYEPDLDDFAELKNRRAEHYDKYKNSPKLHPEIADRLDQYEQDLKQAKSQLNQSAPAAAATVGPAHGVKSGLANFRAAQESKPDNQYGLKKPGE